MLFYKLFGFFFCYAHDFSYLCRIICVAARTMERKEFESYLKKYADQIEAIRQSAHKLHQSVNQTYGEDLPYGYHLDMVVQGIRDFGHLVCAREEDVLPLFFGGYYHDSIEDARLTYNDVMKVARGFLSEEQAVMATEIAYALTNDKGRSRAERAGEKYYQGIRETPYAPFVSTFVFAAVMKHQDAPGTTFKRHMRIAKGVLNEDDYLLQEILFNPYTHDQVAQIRTELKELLEIIDNKDAKGMKGYLTKIRNNVKRDIEIKR